MQDMTEQKQLTEIYERLGLLRREGVKMKDIATLVGVSPSVLSALYATVLPDFCTQVEEKGFDTALDEALSKVNNLSRKRLFEMLGDLHARLQDLSDKTTASIPRKTHPFLNFLKDATAASAGKLGNLEGIYMSYSCSSSVRALKAEPFYFTLAEGSHSFAVGRKSIHGSVREGVGIIQEQQIIYLLFNAFQEPNMSLVTVYLQLPFLENIHYLRGLYLVPDYNKNPIARRIVLVKLSDEYSPEAFEQTRSGIIMQEQFTDEQARIFSYTCERSDYIKMCTLPSPKLDLRDLQAEKRLLQAEAEEFEQ